MQVTAEHYMLAQKQKRNLPITELKRTCVIEFFHSEKSLSITSNPRKILLINGKVHVGRVWSVKIVKEQYQLFEPPNVVENHKQ